MIIDAHVHIGSDVDGASQSIRKLKSNMTRYGIDRSIIFPFNEKEDLVKSSLKLLEHRSASLLPFLRFDPKTMAPERLGELLEHGFYGVKLHPRAQAFDPTDSKYYGLYEKIEDSGKPLLIHTRKSTPFSPKPLRTNGRFSDPDRIVVLAKKFPDMNIIMAHFANLSGDALKAVGKEDNLYVDTSIFGTTFIVKMMCNVLGAEKMVMGSDAPYSDQEIEMLKVRKADISKSEKEKILSGNIRRILSL